MADRRHPSSTNYGLPGLLVYAPSENLENGPGTLDSPRFVSEFPHFRVIGPLETLYQPSISYLPKAPSELWEVRRVQTRWLFKNQPDAFMGGEVLRDILREDTELTRDSENEVINDRPLLAIGQLRDLGVKSGDAAQQVMVVPTGASGESLRIARMDSSEWQWGDAEDAFVNTSTVNPAQRESEVTWTNDGLRITQIKSANDRVTGGTQQWILVQKETSTTILRPEYRDVVSKMSKPNNLSVNQRLSFIDPNPIATIRQSQTGPGAHSDAILLPAAFNQPPQLVIVDEFGYWTAWDLMQVKQLHQTKTVLEFSKCGHIDEGPLDKTPQITSYPSRKHGLLFVGRAEEGKIKDESASLYQDDQSTVTMSRYLLIWNEERVEIFDMKTKTKMPKLGPFLTEKGKRDSILDVQKNPVHQGHLFILTKHQVIWVDMFGPNSTRQSRPKPSILLRCPHLGTKQDDSRIFVCQASKEDRDTALAFTYYPQRRQLSIFWFKMSSKASIPQWHRDTISLPGSDESYARSSIRYIRVDQAQLTTSNKPDALSPGVDYRRDGIEFYQLTILWDDLSLQHCMCAISGDLVKAIRVPDTRVAWSETEKRQRLEQKRLRMMQLLSNVFVLPDDVSTDEIDALMSLGSGDIEARPEAMARRQKVAKPPRPVSLRFGKICEALKEFLNGARVEGEIGLPAGLFDALHRILREEDDYERFPLLTWGEISEQLPHVDELESTDVDSEEMVSELFEQNGERKVITQLTTSKPDGEPSTLIDLPFLRNYFSRLWLEPVMGKLPERTQLLRRAWIDELARDTFLSNYGIMIQDTPLLGPQSAGFFEESQGAMARSQSINSSFLSRDIMSSSPPRPTVLPSEDGAFQRLRMLCSGLRTDKLDLSKHSKVVSYWPTERGVDPANYISSVVRANEELLKDAKERLSRIQAKRKARSEKYKRPAFMRRGLPDLDPNNNKAQRDRSLVGRSPQRPPPVQAMSSQGFAHSSQPMPGPSVAMSQPVSGAFADRKKTKKAKRKSGFR